MIWRHKEPSHQQRGYWDSSSSNGRQVTSWWRHQMEPFSTLLVLCSGNSPVTGEFPPQRPVTWSFDAFFDLHLSKQLSTQSIHWWFKTPSCSLWRHCNVLIPIVHSPYPQCRWAQTYPRSTECRVSPLLRDSTRPAPQMLKICLHFQSLLNRVRPIKRIVLFPVHLKQFSWVGRKVFFYSFYIILPVKFMVFEEKVRI